MTIAGRINILISLIAILGGALLTIFIGQREYVYQREELVRQVAAQVASQPQIQLAVYYREQDQLNAALDGFMGLSRAIVSARLYESQGTVLARKERDWLAGERPASLRELRAGASPLLQTTSTRRAGSTPPGQALMALLSFGEQTHNVTIPITSAVNPLEEGVPREVFGAALADPRKINSLFVTAYLDVGMSSSILRSLTMPTVVASAALGLGFVLFAAIVAVIITRRITSPLARLARVADDIASGKMVEKVEEDGAHEVAEIAKVLNGIISGLHTYKTRMDVDHQLLSMKVEERTQQLSRRNEELNKAVKQVTETKDRLRQMAYFDSLTSLPNRRLFSEQLGLLLRVARRNKQMLALLFLDLDNFKRINDSLGHNAGDQLLREVAHRLSNCVRESDVVAHYVDSESRIDVSRLGGDEFTVVLNQIDRNESAAVVAQRLINALTKPIVIDGHELVVTPSIGIAMAPQDGGDVEGLLKAADTAMYHAKKMGKNNFLFYDSAMDATGVERLRLETDLRRAIERNQLLLHYQPQVDTHTGCVVGAEALLRWEHPDHGLVSPVKFIPIAEEIGIIGELGEWGLQEACRQLKEFREQGLDLPKVSVNVSALQFTPKFIDSIGDVLNESGLSPQSLELELTEGIMMDDKRSTIDALESLKRIGVRLSIDDFGTGYSSLSYLTRFPLDELKIDRSFVIDLDKGEHNANLVAAIIAMAKSLNLELVAEGVETRQQYRFLTEHGAAVIQGYLFSKPVPADELRPLLRESYFDHQIRQINRDLETAS